MIRTIFIKLIKNVFHISNLTVFVRRKTQSLERFFYKKKYTADDIINILKQMGVKPGRPLVVHSSMHNFYNFNGTAEELIDKLLAYLGPEGTLCMPSYPDDKFNPDKVFDVRTDRSAAGYLSEVFRRKQGVIRSMNKLHSICAYGKDAELITSKHHLSKTCFDEYSPYYIIGQLGGYSLSLGMPRWYIGTGEHVCESLLFDELSFFHDKFYKPVTFTYMDLSGSIFYHTMFTTEKHHYTRMHSTKVIDKYFDKKMYCRVKLSNIWIVLFDMKYLYTRLMELARSGITIYTSPKFYK